MTCSTTITGSPTSATATRYVSTKAAPPFEPVRNGNFQMYPRPMAEPTVAAKAPRLDAKASRPATPDVGRGEAEGRGGWGEAGLKAIPRMRSTVGARMNRGRQGPRSRGKLPLGGGSGPWRWARRL